MHQFKPCKKCNGNAIYIHVPKIDRLPPEHIAICDKCGWKTEPHRYSYGMVKEWNKRERK